MNKITTLIVSSILAATAIVGLSAENALAAMSHISITNHTTTLTAASTHNTADGGFEWDED